MKAATALTAPRRIAAFRVLWRALFRRPGPGEPGLAQRVAVLPALLGDSVSGRYPDLGRGRLALFAAALLYLVSPVDLVPEAFLTVFGLGDDAVTAMWLGGALLAEADRYLGRRREPPAGVGAGQQVARTYSLIRSDASE